MRSIRPRSGSTSKYASPHAGLGNIYRNQNRLDAALAEYQTAIRLDRTDAVPHAGLGHVYYAQSKLDAALAEYQTAIRLDPKYALPHVGLGNVYRNQHKPDEAIDEYQTAINLSSTMPDPYYNKGLVLLRESRSSGGGNPERLKDACAAFIDRSKWDRNNPNFLDRIREVDEMMAGQGHCAR